jgi:hypothetical protein
VPVGYWTTVKFSGALPARRVNELLDRVERLQQAVKFAWEEANGADVVDQRVGDAVFGCLFGQPFQTPRPLRPGCARSAKLKLSLVVKSGLTALNLRLSLQTQHSPPIAGSTGPGPQYVEMQVQVLPAQVDAWWSKGRTRRPHD